MRRDAVLMEAGWGARQAGGDLVDNRYREELNIEDQITSGQTFFRDRYRQDQRGSKTTALTHAQLSVSPQTTL